MLGTRSIKTTFVEKDLSRADELYETNGIG